MLITFSTLMFTIKIASESAVAINHFKIVVGFFFFLALKIATDKGIYIHAYLDVNTVLQMKKNKNKRQPRKMDLICKNTNLYSAMLSHFIDAL